MRQKFRLQSALLFFSLWLIVPISYAQNGVTSVDGVSITVSDMDSILGFYTKILPFKLLSDKMSDDSIELSGANPKTRIRKVTLQLGEERIDLIDFIQNEGKTYPADSRSNDLWFQHVAIIVSNMDSAYNWLLQNNVKGISPSPQRLPDWNKNAAGIKAYYFQDPDGHPLEILEFPKGKGNPKWQESNGKLFLGIDHTAIAVSNTAESLKFYRDILGLVVAGSSENYGIEQERLNNVQGAHLNITGLRAQSGIGIEFLEYLEPLNGRLSPSDVAVNDLINSQIMLSTSHFDEIIIRLQRSQFSLKMKLTNGNSNSEKSVVLTDPDGHRILLRGI